MIALGLRLALAGGKQALTRLTMIAIAVAIGVGLLLTTLAGLNAVNGQNARYAWLETGSGAPAITSTTNQTDDPPPATPSLAGVPPLWWKLSADYYQGKQIGRIDVAATAPNSPIPPGVTKLPGPGQYYASPAMARLLKSTPAGQLGDRFAGHQVGTIGDVALPAPNSLIILVGRSVTDLSADPHARPVESISTTVPSNCNNCVIGVGINGNGITLILSVVIAGLLFPVLIFIGGATRLSAARREQRFAAMRLVGATPRQLSVISAVESSVAAMVGVAVGFGLFFALRPELAAIPFTGDPFFTSDLSLSLPDVLFIVLGIPIASAVAARLALRRVNISPLGVSRRVTPRPPRAWRVIPLLAGLGELGYFAYFHDVGANSRATVSTEVAAFLSGILLTMSGLVIAGPWLTMLGSRLMAGRATRPATLIAGRRLADNPKAGFRAISGLVLAVFVGTCALGVITTVVAYDGGSVGDPTLARGTLVDTFRQGPDHSTTLTPADTATFDRVRAVPGVTGVATIHVLSEGPAYRTKSQVIASAKGHPFGPLPDIVSCAQLAGVPALGRCSQGANTVSIDPQYGGAIVERSSTTMAKTTWPAAQLTGAGVQSLPLDSIVVGTNGSAAAVEQARTILDNTYVQTYAAQTLSEFQANSSQQLNSYKQLANVIILTSLPIAGCSLAVSVAGGLADRKRPFSLLRLAGTPLGLLRRVITLEAAGPLIISAVVSAGAGLLTAQLFLRAQLYETLQPPSIQYYVIILAGLVASLAVIASTLPLLRRMTGPEVARND